MGALTIIIDTQEQAPLSFSGPTERGTLVPGDYSVKGLERVVAEEPRSPDDPVGCFKNGRRERFERELSSEWGLGYLKAVEMEDLENRLAKVEQAVLNRDKRGGS